MTQELSRASVSAYTKSSLLLDVMHSTSITLIECVVRTNQAAVTCLPTRHATPAVYRAHNVAGDEASNNAAAALNIDALVAPATLSSDINLFCILIPHTVSKYC